MLDRFIMSYLFNPTDQLDNFIQPESNVICATILTGIYDVNRNERLEADQFLHVEKWHQSIVSLQLKGIIFHNTFSQKTIQTYQNEFITFVEVAYDQRFNPNVFRYLVYQDFIHQYKHAIANLFVTDISDVEVIQNPFVQPLFIENPTALFCGDEPKPLNNDWMNAHNSHLRQSIAGFANYEQQHQAETLLNCGIIGGSMFTMQTLMDQLAQIHRTYTIHNQTPYTLDMGTFNYVARTQFANHLHHGAPVNTVFKAYESERIDCWFRHK